jgi:hypothetical protein
MFACCLLTLNKYGRVERVFIYRDSSGPVPVFVKFTAQLSALRVSDIPRFHFCLPSTLGSSLLF